jgi:hypothetical protein
MERGYGINEHYITKVQKSVTGGTWPPLDTGNQRALDNRIYTRGSASDEHNVMCH